MYLKQQKLVTKAARPSLLHQAVRIVVNARLGMYTHFINAGTQEISKTRLVNGAATDASASEREMPTSAALSAPQSFAPSPQKQQQ